jgi:hypothetical protein
MERLTELYGDKNKQLLITTEIVIGYTQEQI